MILPEINAPLDLGRLKQDLCCVVELDIEPPRPDSNGNFIRPLQQVTLSPQKVSSAGLIRLGQISGDEANCWIRPQHIRVIDILGTAEMKDLDWFVTPIHKEQKAA